MSMSMSMGVNTDGEFSTLDLSYRHPLTVYSVPPS